MIEIREYREEDRKTVEDICRITDSSNLDDDVLLTLYCHYYIEKEKENCFVATDNDRAIGYIISTLNYEKWKRDFTSYYLDKASDKVRKSGLDSISFYSPFSSLYPSHLHIDILPSYERMGIGHRLMDRLIKSLKEKGSMGLMLGVNPENTKAVSFYKKYGFSQLDNNSSVFGIKLS